MFTLFTNKYYGGLSAYQNILLKEVCKSFLPKRSGIVLSDLWSLHTQGL